jgi:hypothetical protein
MALTTQTPNSAEFKESRAVPLFPLWDFRGLFYGDHFLNFAFT